MSLGVTRDITFPANNHTADFTLAWVNVVSLLQHHFNTNKIYLLRHPPNFVFWDEWRIG
jgi:hypothetical protein